MKISFNFRYIWVLYRVSHRTVFHTGEESLWELAKTTGSTMDAIRRANNLENEPSPGQMLLIPIP